MKKLAAAVAKMVALVAFVATGYGIAGAKPQTRPQPQPSAQCKLLPNCCGELVCSDVADVCPIICPPPLE